MGYPEGVRQVSYSATLIPEHINTYTPIQKRNSIYFRVRIVPLPR